MRKQANALAFFALLLLASCSAPSNHVDTRSLIPDDSLLFVIRMTTEKEPKASPVIAVSTVGNKVVLDVKIEGAPQHGVMKCNLAFIEFGVVEGEEDIKKGEALMCFGDCGDKSKKCEIRSKTIGGKEKIIFCACNGEDEPGYCHLAVVEKKDDDGKTARELKCRGNCPKIGETQLECKVASMEAYNMDLKIWVKIASCRCK